VVRNMGSPRTRRAAGGCEPRHNHIWVALLLAGRCWGRGAWYRCGMHLLVPNLGITFEWRGLSATGERQAALPS
jgi:hypothetical protein